MWKAKQLGGILNSNFNSNKSEMKNSISARDEGEEKEVVDFEECVEDNISVPENTDHNPADKAPTGVLKEMVGRFIGNGAKIIGNLTEEKKERSMDMVRDEESCAENLWALKGYPISTALPPKKKACNRKGKCRKKQCSVENNREEPESKKKREQKEENGRQLKRQKTKTNMKNVNLAEIGKELQEKIESYGGNDVKLVIEKKLCKSDLNPRLGRFSIPVNQVRSEFLTVEEKCMLEERSMPINMIEPCSVKTTIHLSKWKSTNSYVLTGNWKLVLEKEQNELKEKEKVWLWSFRINGNLWFAMVKGWKEVATI